MISVLLYPVITFVLNCFVLHRVRENQGRENSEISEEGLSSRIGFMNYNIYSG